MDLNEYNKVKDFSYEEYCDYLKEKYGGVPVNETVEPYIQDLINNDMVEVIEK